MTTLDTSFHASLPRIPAAGRLLSALLHRLDVGSVELTTPEGATLRFGPGGAPTEGIKSNPAVLVFRDWGIAGEALKGGDVAFAESYMEGRWDTPDLTQLLTVLAANQSALERAFYGRWWSRTLLRLKHFLNANTKRQSRKNILAHYDLGNDFYRLWLDESMTYSAACAFEPSQTLEQAQAAKRRRIAELLALSGQESVLEIGCGWGALAIDLAADARHVTGLTLSAEQLAFAEADIAARGLSDKVALHLRDYREEQASFDRVVSIEMLEAVGEEYWPAYFGKLRTSLADRGRAVVQAITIREDRYESYKRSPDFIQRFIFPGGMLPTPAIMEREAAAAGLAITHKECFATGYADTLAEWRRRFLARWAEIEPLGFGHDFKRLWDYYLAYCEAGFRTGTIDVGLYVMEPVRGKA